MDKSDYFVKKKKIFHTDREDTGTKAAFYFNKIGWNSRKYTSLKIDKKALGLETIIGLKLRFLQQNWLAAHFLCFKFEINAVSPYCTSPKALGMDVTRFSAD